jgi:hypothetical protein
MARQRSDNWSVRKCSKICTKCEKKFEDQEILYSRLSFDAGEYARKDFCKACWNKDDPGLSSWKTIFIVPAPQEEAVKKENVESLLRKLVAKDNDEDFGAIFILAVMLERKKVLVERDVQALEDGRKLRIYEHRKTNESFLIVDPGLKLAELGQVQEEVVVLLGGKPREAGSSDPST